MLHIKIKKLDDYDLQKKMCYAECFRKYLLLDELFS